jgi:hypothetical protein
MSDLAWAMTYHQNLKLHLNAGYFDFALFYEGVLPMPAKLRANIEYKFYQSGHTVYANEAAEGTAREYCRLHSPGRPLVRRLIDGPYTVPAWRDRVCRLPGPAWWPSRNDCLRYRAARLVRVYSAATGCGCVTGGPSARISASHGPGKRPRLTLSREKMW